MPWHPPTRRGTGDSRGQHSGPFAAVLPHAGLCRGLCHGNSDVRRCAGAKMAKKSAPPPLCLRRGRGYKAVIVPCIRSRSPGTKGRNNIRSGCFPCIPGAGAVGELAELGLGCVSSLPALRSVPGPGPVRRGPPPMRRQVLARPELPAAHIMAPAPSLSAGAGKDDCGFGDTLLQPRAVYQQHTRADNAGTNRYRRQATRRGSALIQQGAPGNGRA